MSAKTFTIAFGDLKITLHLTPLCIAFALIFIIITQTIADGINSKSRKDEGWYSMKDRIDHLCNSLDGSANQALYKDLCYAVSPHHIVSIPFSYFSLIVAQATEAFRHPIFVIAHAVFAWGTFMDDQALFWFYARNHTINNAAAIMTKKSMGHNVVDESRPIPSTGFLLCLLTARAMMTLRITVGETVLWDLSDDGEKDEVGDETSKVKSQDPEDQAKDIKLMMLDILNQTGKLAQADKGTMGNNSEAMERATSAVVDLRETMELIMSAITNALSSLKRARTNQDLNQSKDVEQKKIMNVCSDQLKLDTDNDKSCNNCTWAVNITLPTPVSSDESRVGGPQESPEFNKEEFCQKLASSLAAFVQAKTDASESLAASDGEHRSEDTHKEGSLTSSRSRCRRLLLKMKSDIGELCTATSTFQAMFHMDQDGINQGMMYHVNCYR